MAGLIDDPADGDRVARKLEASIGRPLTVSGQDVGLAVRIGVARCPADAKDALGLIHRALARSGEAVAVGRAAAAITPVARGGGLRTTSERRPASRSENQAAFTRAARGSTRAPASARW